MYWDISGNNLDSLGDTRSSEEAGELTWRQGTINLGTKDEDHRSRYGIIIRDPKSHGSGDEVVFDIPGDLVEGTVIVKGTSTVVSGGSGGSGIGITPDTKLASEVAGSESSMNLILVGGPCANPAVEAVSALGVTCSGWSLNSGEAILKLVDNGNKVAMLVAGTNALDTRGAAKVASDTVRYSSAFQAGKSEAIVTVASLSDISVS